MLASVLKPVDDTRMLEKIGATLHAHGFDVFIVGYPSVDKTQGSQITFIPLPTFGRRSLKRLIIPWIVFQKINQLKPQLIIINTPELLFVTALNKLLSGRKLVYDVLENYYRNIRFTNIYPAVLRFMLATWVRFTEIIFSPFVDQFLLAEKGYLNELRFARQPVVLENKLPQAVARKYPVERPPHYNLLFSGTLASATGVFEAIRLAKKLHAVDSTYNLTIIGYAAMPSVLLEIREQISGVSFITLIGGDRLVPHKEILRAISLAGTGIIIYPPNPATESAIPTKLYEYLALRLPVLICHTQPALDLVIHCNAGLVLPADVNAAALHHQLTHSTFTFDCGDTVFWESQNRKLLDALKV